MPIFCILVLESKYSCVWPYKVYMFIGGIDYIGLDFDQYSRISSSLYRSYNLRGGSATEVVLMADFLGVNLGG